MNFIQQIYQFVISGSCNPVYNLSNLVNDLIWIAQFYIAINFTIYSFRKLTFTWSKLRTFIEWIDDYPPYFVRFIGIAELSGAFGLIFPLVIGIMPYLTIASVCGLILLMILGSITHLIRGEYQAVLRDEVKYILLLFFIFWGRNWSHPYITC